MDKSDQITSQASPPHKFSRLNQSVQFLPDDPSIGVPDIGVGRAEEPKMGVRQTLYFRDQLRKKNVCCTIQVYQLNAIQLERSKKGSKILIQIREICRICLNEEETSKFIFPCDCKGSGKFVHEECLKLWILQKNGIEKLFKRDISCEVCSYMYDMKIQFVDKFDWGQVKRAPSHVKACWIFLILLLILLLLGASLIAILVGFQNNGANAAITVMLLVTIFIGAYLTSLIFSTGVMEHVINWHFENNQQIQLDMGRIIMLSPNKRNVSSPRKSVRQSSPRRTSILQNVPFLNL
ncbi:hypothetical protein pb186bvf_018551 [Paramecium bursaria]